HVPGFRAAKELKQAGATPEDALSAMQQAGYKTPDLVEALDAYALVDVSQATGVLLHANLSLDDLVAAMLARHAAVPHRTLALIKLDIRFANTAQALRKCSVPAIDGVAAFGPAGLDATAGTSALLRAGYPASDLVLALKAAQHSMTSIAVILKRSGVEEEA